MGEKISENLEHLVYEIPLEQRKRMLSSKAYREGWRDSTVFWKIQLDKTFKQGEGKE